MKLAFRIKSIESCLNYFGCRGKLLKRLSLHNIDIIWEDLTGLAVQMSWLFRCFRLHHWFRYFSWFRLLYWLRWLYRFLLLFNLFHFGLFRLFWLLLNCGWRGLFWLLLNNGCLWLFFWFFFLLLRLLLLLLLWLRLHLLLLGLLLIGIGDYVLGVRSFEYALRNILLAGRELLQFSLRLPY